LQVALSFQAHNPSVLGCLQILSIPLFMGYPVLGAAVPAQLILIIAYILLWFAILKVKFYGQFSLPLRELRLRGRRAAVFSAAILAASLSLASLCFLKFPLEKALGQGVFPALKIGQGIDEGASEEDKEYYRLQSQLIKKITDLLPQVSLAQDRQGLLGIMDRLVRDPAVVLVVEQAEEGLISMMKNPGLGIEKGEGEEALYIWKKYRKSKAGVNMRRVSIKIIEALKAQPWRIAERMKFKGLAEEVRQAQNPQQAFSAAAALKRALASSAYGENIKAEAGESTQELLAWKLFELGEKAYSPPASPAGQEQLVPAAVEPAPEPPAPARDEEGLPPPIAQAGDEKVAAPVTAARQQGLFIWALSLFLVVAAGVFAFLYYRLCEKRRKLRLLSRADPRAFTLRLYDNLRGVLFIFGARFSGHMPPRIFAAAVEEKYAMDKRPLANFTLQYEEAKYSVHALGPEFAAAAAGAYNGFIKALCVGRGQARLAFRRLIALLAGRPLEV
jgi:hypothetical protein